MILIVSTYLSACTNDRKQREEASNFLQKTVDKNAYVAGIVDGNPEPPYPDLSEDMKTVVGIDADNDGIRDDLEIYINRTGSTINARNLMRQRVKMSQKALSGKSDSAAGITFMRDSDRASGCESFIRVESKNLSKELRDFVKRSRFLIFNTNERIQKINEVYNSVESRLRTLAGLHELFYVGEKFCDFNVENIDEIKSKIMKKLHPSNFSQYYKEQVILKKIQSGEYYEKFGINFDNNLDDGAK